MVSEEAELLSRPAGHWLGQTDGDEEIVFGKILYIMQEISAALNSEGAVQESVEQIWIKLENSHVIVLQCRPDVYLVIKANSKAYLGELRKVVEGAAKSVQQLMDADSAFPFSGVEGIGPTDPFLSDSDPPNLANIASTNIPGKLRGREFIE